MRMSEDFDNVMDVNLKSVLIWLKPFSVRFKATFSSIINMSSVVEWNAGQTNYAAQKRALLVFKSVALELGSRNIRCNVIAP
jgi:3-oxoacyl-[acyl-carrier protein] reductase